MRLALTTGYNRRSEVAITIASFTKNKTVLTVKILRDGHLMRCDMYSRYIRWYEAHHWYPFDMGFEHNYNGIIMLSADLEWYTKWLLGKRCSPELDIYVAVRIPELRRNEWQTNKGNHLPRSISCYSAHWGRRLQIEENRQRRGSCRANLIYLNFAASLPVNKYIHTYIDQGW